MGSGQIQIQVRGQVHVLISTVHGVSHGGQPQTREHKQPPGYALFFLHTTTTLLTKVHTPWHPPRTFNRMMPRTRPYTQARRPNLVSPPLRSRRDDQPRSSPATVTDFAAHSSI